MCLTIREVGEGAEKEGTLELNGLVIQTEQLITCSQTFLSFPLFDTLKSVIHYFQFVNIMHVFQPSYSLSADPVKLEHSVQAGWPAIKCSIGHLVLYTFDLSTLLPCLASQSSYLTNCLRYSPH